jgi:gliding motility-associated-like protein
VFTPNGDGVNDEFVIKYQSLRSIHVQIFNRWGKKIHSWENNNVQGFDATVSESAWDGKIGGRYASPGVYYYVVKAKGRDDKTQNAHGFVHLFREK